MKKMFILATVVTSALSIFSMPSLAQTLNVYTYDSFVSKWGPGPDVKANFEKQCDCTLNFVSLDSSFGILSRVQLEGNNSNADVILGLDLNLMKKTENIGVLAKSEVDTSKVTIPGGWKDPIFVPFDQSYFAFIYNSDNLKRPPTSLKDVVDNQRLRVIYEDPRTNTLGLGLLLWMKSVYGDKALDAWSKLAQHTVTVSKNWSDAYGLFLKGESDLVFSYTTSPVYHIMEEGVIKYKAAPANEGYYSQVEVAAMMKKAPHPKLAKEFMAFLLRPGFQSTILTGNWMLPVTKLLTPIPKAFREIERPTKVLTLSATEVDKNRTVWVNEWLEATTR